MVFRFRSELGHGVTFLGVAIGVHLHEEVEVVIFVGEVIVHLAADEFLEGVFAVGRLEGLDLGLWD